MSGAFAGSLKADLQHVPLGKSVVAWLQQHAWLAAPVLFAIVPIIQAARTRLGPPWIKEVIHDLLDTFQEHVFAREADAPLHYHRVTLFKYVRLRWAWCRWPWTGWLLPVVRSGHTTQKIHTAFRTPDNADRVEGIAGQTWARNRVVMESGLPDLSGSPLSVHIAEYARQTGVAERWIRQRRPLARSYCGIPVEVKGKLWGVIVLDSRSADAITQTPIEDYRLIGRTLSKVLEGSKG
jgi:hypothetical protein